MTNRKILNLNKIILCSVIACFAISVVGCANGPIRKLLRGGACNSCQPPSSHPPGNFAPGCTNCGQGDQLPIQPGFDGYSSNLQPGANQGITSGYGGVDLNGSYYQSNVGGATINPSINGSGSLGGPIVPPNGTGF